MVYMYVYYPCKQLSSFKKVLRSKFLTAIKILAWLQYAIMGKYSYL